MCQLGAGLPHVCSFGTQAAETEGRGFLLIEMSLGQEGMPNYLISISLPKASPTPMGQEHTQSLEKCRKQIFSLQHFKL